ncbi:MAG: aldolase/citrate lyase family protein [Candidatus Omnitrophica bacterium]|nr:aldolase/citrate lyase family protein [Candidatus Omnitrophota bacterium]
MTDLKSSISKKRLSIGSWIQLPDVFSAEIMAKAGFDWLAIDMEHGLIDLNYVYKLIQVINLSGGVPLVRLNENDPSTIRRVMDAGAGGVIVPMINCEEDARKALDAVNYPPTGKRSFGLGRAHQYGKKFESYIRKANRSSILVVQIEHINALDNLDSILNLKGIDACIIGPYDLSGSMGIPGKFNDKRFNAVLDKIIKAVKDSDKLLGIHIVNPDERDLKRRIAQGFKFIAYGMDTIFLQKAVSCVPMTKRYR